jgi:MoaA/NifB/PqqE/SkfB family radical SAM enzyme
MAWMKNFGPTEKNLRRFEYKEGRRKEKPPIQCIYPFRQPTIKWDGTVIGCEFNYKFEQPWGKLGEQKFADIWNIQKGRKGTFCEQRCPFQDRVQDDCNISCKELHPTRGQV